MTLRKIMVFPLLISMFFLAFYSKDILSSFEVYWQRANFDGWLVAVIIIAIILQFVGHIIRAAKMKRLIKPVKESSLNFQFRALSIGYLFNIILPFKLGEVFRSIVISRGERISLGLSLLMVLMDRAMDIIILSIILTILIASGIVSSTITFVLLTFFIIGALSMVLIWFIVKQKSSLVYLIGKMTSVFNDSLKNDMRFKTWSVFYGAQRIISRKELAAFVIMSVGSWIFYVASMAVLMFYLSSRLNIALTPTLWIAPYYGMSVPSGPANLGSFSKMSESLINGFWLSENNSIALFITAWGLLVLPMMIVGVVLLFWKTKEPLRRRLPRSASLRSLSEKLERRENISLELGSFLDNYFAGNELSRIVHGMELKKGFSLIKYFKGGSDAITILALQDKTKIVKKIIPDALAPRLKAQYDWLIKYGGKNGIVKVLGEEFGSNYYSIDIAYDPKDEMFFEYMHHSTPEANKVIMRSVWSSLEKGIYKKTEWTVDYKAIDQYIQKHILACMKIAKEVNAELNEASEPKRIVVNGVKYHNLYEIISKIKNNKQAMKDLASYSRSAEVHGDVAIDNIMVTDQGGVRIIDPAPDGNIISGPVFDFGKIMQSLYCGYEFIIRSSDNITLKDDGRIEFHDRLSVPYSDLCVYVINDLSKKYLTEGERRAIIFHAGALLIRRLKHQVYQAPGLTLAIYGAGIKALNDFYSKYKD